MERDPQQLCVRPERFAQHLTSVLRMADLVPMKDLLSASRGRRVAVTFDDGYQDNLLEAEPVLAARGVQATVFVTAGMVGSDSEFWWDRLDQIIHSGHDIAYLDLHAKGRPVRIDLRSPAGRERGYWSLHSRLRTRPPAEVEMVIQEIARSLGVEPISRPSHRILNVEELQALSDSPSVDIGSHTLSHPYLASLAPADQIEEVAGSKKTLEEMTGRPVRTFSYPFGETEAINDASVSAVRAAGYEAGCANVPGRVTRRTDPFRVPRFLVRDWERDEFERRLSTWLTGRS